MTRAMAVLGYFLKMATMAYTWLVGVVVSVDDGLTVNVLGLVDAELTNGKLTVGGLGCAVTTGQVVDDKCGNLVARDVFDSILDDCDLFTGITTYLLV
jgi:hypothetical protein